MCVCVIVVRHGHSSSVFCFPSSVKTSPAMVKYYLAWKQLAMGGGGRSYSAVENLPQRSPFCWCNYRKIDVKIMMIMMIIMMKLGKCQSLGMTTPSVNWLTGQVVIMYPTSPDILSIFPSITDGSAVFPFFMFLLYLPNCCQLELLSLSLSVR